MKYTINWIDATLKENWKKINKSSDIEYIDEYEANDGWIEYTSVHTFEAENDDKAKEYAKQYEFNYRDIEVWSLMKEDEVIMTEEDLEKKQLNNLNPITKEDGTIICPLCEEELAGDGENNLVCMSCDYSITEQNYGK